MMLGGALAANRYEDSNWGVGRNYLGICEAIQNQTENAKNVAEAIQQLLCGEKDDFQMGIPATVTQNNAGFCYRLHASTSKIKLG